MIDDASFPFIKIRPFHPDYGFTDIPWTRICTTTPSKTSDITIEGILEAVEQAKRIPKPEHDAFVMLERTWRKLRAEFKSELELSGDLHDRLTGIPVYTVTNDTEMRSIYLQLLSDGKWPLVIQEE